MCDGPGKPVCSYDDREQNIVDREHANQQRSHGAVRENGLDQKILLEENDPHKFVQDATR